MRRAHRFRGASRKRLAEPSGCRSCPGHQRTSVGRGACDHGTWGCLRGNAPYVNDLVDYVSGAGSGRAETPPPGQSRDGRPSR